MTEIKRYHEFKNGVVENEHGMFVKYDDHAAIVASLQEQVRALVADGSAIKQVFKQAANTVEECELYSELKYLVEPSEYEALADAIEETPNTDAALREIRAQGAIDARNALVVAGDGADIYAVVTDVAARIRAGEQP